jgi:hypothetical protein
MKCDELVEDRMDALYGEADGPTLVRLEEHEASCARCRDERLALRGLRETLQAFGELESNHQSPRLAERGRWLLAAAAIVLAIGGAFGLAGTEVGYRDGHLDLRVGRGGDVSALLARQEERHQAEIAAIRASLSRPDGLQSSTTLDEVKSLVMESERRQQESWRADLVRLEGRASTARRLDIARVSAGLAYLDRRNSSDAARTAEWMGYVLQASDER